VGSHTSWRVRSSHYAARPDWKRLGVEATCRKAYSPMSKNAASRTKTEQTENEDSEAAMVNKITTTGTNVLFFILLTHVGEVRGKRVAEIGCGNGRGTELLSTAVGPNGVVLARSASQSLIRTLPFAMRVYIYCTFFSMTNLMMYNLCSNASCKYV
jgi:hypothetical protein